MEPRGRDNTCPFFPNAVNLYSALARCRMWLGRMPNRSRKNAMATAHTTNDLTRQQLDELDALLQKMLALPLNAPDGGTSSSGSPSTTSRSPIPELPLTEIPQSSHRAVSPALYTPPISRPFSAPSNRETAPSGVWRGDLSSSPATGPQLLAMPTANESTPATITRKPQSSQSRSVETSALPSPTPFKEEVSSPLILPKASTAPMSASSPVAVTTSRQVAEKMPPVPTLLAPLVSFNVAVNFGLGQLGLPGRILRSGFVKNVLAFVGLGLLVYTGAKVAQLQGLIASSITLPWPT